MPWRAWFSTLMLLMCWMTVVMPAFGASRALDVNQSPGRGEQMAVDALSVQARQSPKAELVLPPAQAPWRPLAQGVRALGFPVEGVWLRGVLSNTGAQAIHRWVVVGEAFLDQVDCRTDTSAGSGAVYRLGDNRPYDERPVPYPRIIVPVEVPAHGQTQVQCYFRNNGAVTVAFEVWEPEAYALSERLSTFNRALCYGALAFAIVCGVVLAVFQRHPLPVLLIVELLPVLVATATREGDAFAFMWPNAPWLNVPPFEWILVGIVAAATVFRRILRLSSGEDRVVRWIIATSLMLLVVAVAFSVLTIQVGEIAQYFAVLVPPTLIAICLRHWRHDPISRVVAVGMLAQFIGLIINALGVLGYLDIGYALAALYASVFKAMALVIALAYRIKLDRMERDKAQSSHMQELEQRVAYEAQLRHAVSHHPRYGMPNQALLDEAVRQCLPDVPPPGLSVWILRMNRFGFLESILPRDTLTELVEIYAEELARWFADRNDFVLLAIDGEHRIAALDDGTLCFVTLGEPSQEILSDLGVFVTRRFEHKGLFVAWDPHVGVATLPAGGECPSGVTEEARVALQWCSAHRRVVRFEAERMKREQLAYGLTLDLEGAIERGELILHYQPKIQLPSRKTVSLEALVRWRHPSRGMIPPGAFIAEAEATGAINRLTLWAIREAARFLLTLPEGDVRVSVNITAFDLATPKFVDNLLSILKQEGCPPQRIILEVTESAALSDRERATEILSALRTAGIQIALDDFGTGYSSLAILQEMPLDEMKVDRSFVTDIGEFERKRAVLEAMIDVGHRLGLTVTIEGVEHEESVEWLTRNGCDVVQGFVFSRPLEPNLAREWVSRYGPNRSPAPAKTVGAAALSH